MDAVVIPFICQSLDFKVTHQSLSVSGLFIFSALVNKPNAIQTILAAVVTHPKSSTNLIPPGGRCPVCMNETNSRSWRDYLGHSLHWLQAPWITCNMISAQNAILTSIHITINQ